MYTHEERRRIQSAKPWKFHFKRTDCDAFNIVCRLCGEGSPPVRSSVKETCHRMYITQLGASGLCSRIQQDKL